MTATPTVSVVVPNYNHARFLRQRIDSILTQTYQDFELILLDDRSTDEGREILREYASDPHVSHVEFNEENSGSTFKQWNKGVRLARGKYVWIAESDDYADARFLARVIGPLETSDDVALSYSRSWRVSADGTVDGFWDSYLGYLDPNRWAGDFFADGREECRKYLVRCNTVQSASSVLFRRDPFWEVGGADESLVLGGDWKTWAAMALSGGRVSHVGEPLNFCRFHEASVSEKNLRNGVWADETLVIVAWILERVGWDERSELTLCDELSKLWLPAVTNGRFSFSRRWAILRRAAAVDSHAFRRLARLWLAGIWSRGDLPSSYRA